MTRYQEHGTEETRDTDCEGAYIYLSLGERGECQPIGLRETCLAAESCGESDAQDSESSKLSICWPKNRFRIGTSTDHAASRVWSVLFLRPIRASQSLDLTPRISVSPAGDTGEKKISEGEIGFLPLTDGTDCKLQGLCSKPNALRKRKPRLVRTGADDRRPSTQPRSSPTKRRHRMVLKPSRAARPGVAYQSTPALPPLPRLMIRNPNKSSQNPCNDAITALLGTVALQESGFLIVPTTGSDRGTLSVPSTISPSQLSNTFSVDRMLGVIGILKQGMYRRRTKSESLYRFTGMSDSI